MNLKTIIAIVLVFVACCFNVMSLEILVKFSSSSSQLITFSQFFFISCYGFVTVSKFGTQKSSVPLKEYFLTVILFYTSSITGNAALGCNIAMPIQMIFKSGSVLASLALGVLLLKRRYNVSKYIAVAMITIGISMCLLISAGGKNPQASTEEPGSLLLWFFGIVLLLSSLFLGARLGISQEQISLKYGKHPNEMLYYSHVLALPAFVFFTKSIINEVDVFNKAELYHLPVIGVSIPYIWIYLAANVFTQFVCIKSVYTLASEMSALTVTVLLTLRKFTSLVISIVYFQNPFTLYHWVGSVFVFAGTLLFSGVIHDLLGIEKEKKEKKEE